MCKFALKRIGQVKGRISFYKMEINGECLFDSFCTTLDAAGERTVLISIFASMESVANLLIMPKTRFRELKGRIKSDTVKDYEIKKNRYRVYLFKDDNGNIVVLGGIKDTQKEDIKRLRRIKIQYCKAKKI